MRVIIVGCGKVGSLLTAYIAREGHDVVVIDTSAPVIEDVVNQYDVMGVAGNGASHEVMVEAGVASTDLVIAVTGLDELNIMCCMMARKMGARHTIARVRNPEYNAQLDFMRRGFGLSMVVNPEFDAAHEIMRIVQFPEALKVDTFAKGRVDMVEHKIGHEHPLCGKTLSDLRALYGVSVLICAVNRGDEVIIPSGNFTLAEDDIIHVTAQHRELVTFFKKLGITEKRIRNVLIIGGGKITYFLTKRLCSLGIGVKIIEADRDRAVKLAEQLPEAMIIHGDGTDSDLLLEEGIDQVDATISLTGIDEENIIISMFASTRKVEKVITKINRLNLIKMLSSIGLECIVTPKTISANNVLRYIRALKNSEGSNIQTLYKLADDKAEAIEFVAADTFGSFGIPLKDLRLKPNVLLGCIIRGNKIIYPHGGDAIEPGDNVIVVAKSDDALSDLSDIIA